jgi:hypothetical protein
MKFMPGFEDFYPISFFEKCVISDWVPTEFMSFLVVLLRFMMKILSGRRLFQIPGLVVSFLLSAEWMNGWML